jgi:iron complex transport system permease protein
MAIARPLRHAPPPASGAPAAGRWRTGGRLRPAMVLGGLLLAVVLALLAGAGTGAYPIAPARLFDILLDTLLAGGAVASLSPEHLVFTEIRAPRLALAVWCGAALGAAGALMQGVFRNPLADPGLVGVSAGAALAAALAIVAGAWWFPALPRLLGSWTLVVCAFGGALAVSALTYSLAQVQGATRLSVMLLAGIAVNALAGALLGWLSIIATDAQLRALQFWLLGSLGGARWGNVALVGGLVALSIVGSMRLARALDAMALGEPQAHALGVPVERVKRLAVVWVALAVGATTAVTGVVGFVGLVAPHLVRLAAGPGHRVLVPGSALAGAVLVLVSDAFARTVAAPAEVPLGVLTALVGTPFFLWLLLRMRQRL